MGQAVGTCTAIRLSIQLGVLPATAIVYAIAYSTGCCGPIWLVRGNLSRPGTVEDHYGRQQHGNGV
jgi:hypothetical protein